MTGDTEPTGALPTVVTESDAPADAQPSSTGDVAITESASETLLKREHGELPEALPDEAAPTQIIMQVDPDTTVEFSAETVSARATTAAGCR